MKTLDHDEVARNFMSVLDEVDRGETIFITENGNVIAQITPIDKDTRQDYLTERKQKMLERLDKRKLWTAQKWTRDELHEDVSSEIVDI